MTVTKCASGEWKSGVLGRSAGGDGLRSARARRGAGVRAPRLGPAGPPRPYSARTRALAPT